MTKPVSQGRPRRRGQAAPQASGRSGCCQLARLQSQQPAAAEGALRGLAGEARWRLECEAAWAHPERAHERVSKSCVHVAVHAP